MRRGAARIAGRERAASRWPRTATGVLATTASAVVLVLGTLALAPVGADAAAPLLYTNGVQLKLEPECASESLPLLSECPNQTEQRTVSSRHVPWVSWGAITLNTASVGMITCTVTALGSAWNEREHASEAEPLRAYGSVEGWGTSECTAPELVEGFEETAELHGYGPLTPFVTAEPPLIDETTEASICDEAERHATPPVTKPSKCPHESERELVTLPSVIKRRVSTLPWRAEVVRGYNRGGEEVPRLRVGIAAYGECGPGRAEGSRGEQLCGPSAGEESEGRSACYPTRVGYQHVPQGCVVFNVVIPQIPVEIPFYGSEEMAIQNGIKNGLSRTSAKAEEASSGTLVSLSGGHAAAEGRLNGLGTQGIELLTLK